MKTFAQTALIITNFANNVMKINVYYVKKIESHHFVYVKIKWYLIKLILKYVYNVILVNIFQNNSILIIVMMEQI